MADFLYIIPRMPKRLRNELRETLYSTMLDSLLNQTSKNWKAIILGDISGDEPLNKHFVYVEADDFPKTEKLRIALKYIEEHPEIKPEYIIRLDADDFISPDYLSVIEGLPEKFDLYYDDYHVCVDPVYMKISYRKNPWVANTAIHKFEHAIKRCGPQNEVLFLQDHNAYWHEYYSDKNKFTRSRINPLYYRILTPYSITSNALSDSRNVEWPKHLSYLNSYGPWIKLPESFFAFDSIKKVNAFFKKTAPKRSLFYWLFNSIKHYKNRLSDLTPNKSGKNLTSEDEKNIPSHYQECARCLLTTKDTVNITFDKEGVCNYCGYYDASVAKLGDERTRLKWVTEKLKQIKNEGKNKPYDCILGVSGGVDSSYLSYWARQNGLRPLVVHFDNGWNSELATENIQNICDKLSFELNTYVINWEEFKELQVAYLKAGVVDMEALTDHAIMATICNIAAKYKIKYTLNGFNYATEAIMPKGWVFDKGDWENIKDIYKKFGSDKKLKTFPHITFYKKLFYHWFLKLESIQVLNYISYNKDEAKKIITNELSWRDYGGKHYESVFTKFYQAYILPTRFGIDKRKAHLSNLICSGQINKELAIEELKRPLYNEQELNNEKEYVLKKLGLTKHDFDKIMKQPRRAHIEFKTEREMWRRYFKFVNLLRLRFK